MVKKIAECKKCQATLSYRATRLKSHYEKCENSERAVKGIKREHSPFSEAESPPKKRSAPILRQMRVNSSVIRTSSDMKHSLDIQVARFFYACNIAFNVAEHPAFKNLISTLRPGYFPPNRKELGDNLLDEVYTEAQSSMKAAIDGKTGTLIQDGWSNVHNEPIVATSHLATLLLVLCTTRLETDWETLRQQNSCFVIECFGEIMNLIINHGN